MTDEFEVLGPEDDFDQFPKEERDEMLGYFIEEFEELMAEYGKALQTLRRPRGDKLPALQVIFRVYHTLKGSAGHFSSFLEFRKFTSHFCEQLRNPREEMLEDELLIRNIRLNYSRLSTAVSALNRGKSLKTMRFSIFLKNF